MSDLDIRQLERAARAGDPEARKRLVVHRLRAGGRDPRKDPRPGDLVRNPRRGLLVVQKVHRWSRSCTTLHVVGYYKKRTSRGRGPTQSLSNWRRFAPAWEVVDIAELLASDTPCAMCGLPAWRHEEVVREEDQEVEVRPYPWTRGRKVTKQGDIIALWGVDAYQHPTPGRFVAFGLRCDGFRVRQHPWEVHNTKTHIKPLQLLDTGQLMGSIPPW